MVPSRLACIALSAALLFAACGADPLDSENDLVVVNDSGCDLTVYVDGRTAFTVKAGSDSSLDDVGIGRHVLEALDGHGNLVKRRSIELAAGEDYYWLLNDC